MHDFLLRALLAGIGVALVAAPLGTFVVWRRMAYFGDTLAHSALLGVALGLLMAISVDAAIVAVCVLLALLLVALQARKRLASDTLLGILSHAALALGLIAVTLVESVRVDLMGYLFGDILAVSDRDVAWVWGGGALVLGLLAAIWRPLLAITVHEELARVEGVPVAAVRSAFMILMALVIAVAMKVVGILLVTSLLIIPAATAHHFARSPEQMAGLAAGLGTASVAGGLYGSWQWDLPAGPTIVVAAAGLFFLAPLLPSRSD